MNGSTTYQQENVVSFILPFKDKKSPDIVRRQLAGLGCLIGKALRAIFTSRKIRDDVKIQEEKPPLVNHDVICAMQIMLAILVDTHISVLMNTRGQW